MGHIVSIPTRTEVRRTDAQLEEARRGHPREEARAYHATSQRMVTPTRSLQALRYPRVGDTPLRPGVHQA
eukprot:9151029-Pyramimonas_sp.AAC.1